METQDHDQDATIANSTDQDRQIYENGSHYLRNASTDLDVSNVKEWYEEFTAADGETLSPDSSIVQCVSSDHLNTDLIEDRVTRLASSIEVRQRFCSACHDLFNNWPDLDQGLEPEITSLRSEGSDESDRSADWQRAVTRSCCTVELEAATRQGCRFCAFLMQTLRDADQLDTFRKVEARLGYLGKDVKACLSIQNWANALMTSSQILWLNLPGKISGHCNNGWASNLKVYAKIFPSSADCFDQQREALDIAKDWLQTCLRDHTLCNKSSATLSHCWGSGKTFRLTPDNYDSCLSTIQFEELPKTFKDAIETTRRIGLQYLWIDSLCIIQGDEDDWRRKAATMSSVYGGSSINIAATSAPDDKHGCFLKQPYFSGGLRAKVTIKGKQRVQEFRSSDVYRDSVEDTYLATRAWALQERLLSPRTLSLGIRGAHWACSTMTASEYLPEKIIGLRQYVPHRVHGFKDVWYEIVPQYSAGALTFPKDKLPALAGIARRVYDEAEDDYLAGMWRDHFEAQLCWTVVEPSAHRPPWRAPTWSWASIDGKVLLVALTLSRTKHLLPDIYTHLRDYDVKALGLDPFGEVAIGALRLSCSVMVACRITDKAPSSGTQAGKTEVVVDSDDGQDEFPVQMDCSDEFPRSQDEIVYLLPMIGGENGTHEKPQGGEWIKSMSIFGILLRPTGINKGEFHRIGSFEFRYGLLWKSEGTEDFYNSFLKILGKEGTKTAEAVCTEVITDSEYPEERFLITLL
ncbi:MAG: hypothetical protein M1820_009154 [Bogoriella megaspora]|nr:MAG: hypothetical protein M1820_009154 [Bogoriella megaspora]